MAFWERVICRLALCDPTTMRGGAGYKAATLSPAIKESLYGLFLKAVNSSNGHLRLAGIQCAKTIFPLNDVPSRLIWYEASSEGH
jgi:hypothetical protein